MRFGGGGWGTGRAGARPRGGAVRGAGGRVAGGVIGEPGRTLRRFGVRARDDRIYKARNMTFRPVQFVRAGEALRLGTPSVLDRLFDPDSRQESLAWALRQIRQDRGTAQAARLAALLRDTGPKVIAAVQLNAPLDRLLGGRWARPVEVLLGALREYASEDVPDWYLDELGRLGAVDPAHAEL